MQDNKQKPGDITTTLGMDMSTQTLIDNAGAAQEKVDSIITEMGEPKNTGGGAAAATDTTYSWDQQGTDKATVQLGIDKEGAKQEALANRQTIEQNAQNYQQQADLMKYSNNQSAQSAGWTGGYVLDQNRQMEYLKSSIQSQMYGAMELQKYGYDTALAAARLSYDLNQKEFAHQYYMDAVNVAVTEAQTTGYYVSAEVRDMMSQYNIAQEKLTKNPSDTQAQAVTQGVKKWFESNFNTDGVNISDATVKTLSLLTSELSAAQSTLEMYINTYYEQLTRIQAADSAAAAKVENDPSYFIVYDVNGKEKYDPTTGKYEMGNFDTMTKEEIATMITANEKNEQRFHAYIDSAFEKDIQNYLKGVTTGSGDDASVEIIIEELENKLNSSNIPNEYKDLLKGYEYVTEAGKSTVIISINNKGEITATVSQSEDTSKGQVVKEQKENAENLINKYNLSDEKANTITTMLATQGNKGIDMKELQVNSGGDTFSNNYGDRGEDNNFSLLLNGEKIRVQNGKRVKDNCELDIVLESYSTNCGACAIVDGILYVRDNNAWYVVEARDNSYASHWQKIAAAYDLNYTVNPSKHSEYYN